MITISGSELRIADIAAVARGAKVRLADDADTRARIDASRAYIQDAVDAGKAIYGVTTLFGGMADQYIPPELAAQLQQNLVFHLSATAGELLPVPEVRAALLLRANSLIRGVSGIRFEILQRFATFLNAGATPLVHEHGSIGASGDLIPLAYMAGALTGISADYKVDLRGEIMDAPAALRRLGLEPIPLAAKEGLALANGTAVCTGVAANCIDRARYLLAIAMAVHAIYIQALTGTAHSFDPFIHQHKPHPGQVRVASEMARLLAGSRLTFDAVYGDIEGRRGRLVQDRYSLRCLPQFLGPVVDGLNQIAAAIEVEANSANDNPLIDVPGDFIHHGGNFLAQYTGVGMDQLRYHLGMAAKHLDVQIALLVEPAFSNGLPPCLVGNPERGTNLGLKALQTAGNSIMPLISWYGNSLADRFPTHAEQFNQNVNSQAMGSALLARRSLDLLEHYLANALLFAVQAADLRSKLVAGTCDARRTLSPETAVLYEAVRTVLGVPPDDSRPLIFDDRDQFLGGYVARVLGDIRARAHVAGAVGTLAANLFH